MESAEAPLRVLKTNLVFYTEVVDVKEHFRDRWINGVGDDAVFEQVSVGWFMYLLGSHEAIHIGSSGDWAKPGDQVKITFEKVNNAKP